MEYREFGKTGVKVSVIGMGTYYDPMWIFLSRLGVYRQRESKIDAMKAGLDGGVNLIDTAEIYGSEPLVAEAIRDRRRDELFIATKVWPTHLSWNKMGKAIDGSLRRLGLKYVDLYQVHFPGRTSIKETMQNMEKLVDAGKILHIGVSNFNMNQLMEAVTSLKKHELTAVQLNYSLANRSIEKDIVPYCMKEGIAVLAYYPLGHGKLASNATLRRIGERLGKTPAQVALNWLVRKGAFPIPRASRRNHVLENLGATGWSLDDAAIKELEEEFKP
ncbi:aldo/keto reductase [Thermocladium modestius]|uniref:Aldo/keto reductase n=1 Tax=Thermocladium modestius TaxID=62609 RepID=A0A830GT32_9CREN|nr:aldo/keto reductase [Thermocladium modestius]GGP20120.1 aldo/keto reductase [Thermocladium modestius]